MRYSTLKFIKFVKFTHLSCYFMLLSMSFTGHAQQFDQAYLKWKAEQQAQDATLNKIHSNYYLSRPAVTAHASNPSSPSAGGKISINSAGIEQLQQLNGAGPKKAQAILDYRNQHGKFKTIEELSNVKGIGAKFIEKNRSLLGL